MPIATSIGISPVAGFFYFLTAVLSLVGIAVFLCRRWGLRGGDALCATPLLLFLALNISALLPSFFQILNGAIWMGMLLSLAVGAFLARGKKSVPNAEIQASLALGWPDFLLVFVLCLPLLVNQIVRPVTNWDDLMYHGSRAGYWLTNHSILPFPAHNDRLVSFPVGGDLWFALGVFTTHGEVAGKLLVFLAYPFSLLLMLATARLLGVRAWLARFSVAVFACLPLFRTGAVSIKPDLWLVVFVLASAYWFLRGTKLENSFPRAPFWLALSLGCAVGVKWTVAPMFLLLGPVLWQHRASRSFLAISGTLIFAVVCGGAGPALVHNLQTAGHPLGAKRFREVHLPDPGWKTASVNLRRVPFQLLDFPVFPDEETRLATARHLNVWAHSLGASQTLTWEEPGSIPGPFYPNYGPVSYRFSLLWVFLLLGIVVVPLALWKRRRSLETAWIFFLTANAALLFLMVILQTRWQPQAGLPDRFLFPALALGSVLWAWAGERTFARHRLANILLGGVLALHMIPFLLGAERIFDTAVACHWAPPTSYVTKSEFEEPARIVGSGKSILLFASQGALDYPLFDAQHGFTNRVFPWGKSPYDARRLQSLLNDRHIDAIVFEQAAPFQMLWDPDFDPAPFIAYVAKLSGFKKIPTQTSNLVFLLAR